MGFSTEDIRTLELDEAIFYSVPGAVLGVFFAGGLTLLFLGPFQSMVLMGIARVISGAVSL